LILSLQESQVCTFSKIYPGSTAESNAASVVFDKAQ